MKKKSVVLHFSNTPPLVYMMKLKILMDIYYKKKMPDFYAPDLIVRKTVLPEDVTTTHTPAELKSILKKKPPT